MESQLNLTPQSVSATVFNVDYELAKVMPGILTKVSLPERTNRSIVGISHLYSTPPAVRRVLPMLLGAERLKPEVPRAPDFFAMIDSALAACLEYAADPAYEPGCLFVLSGTPDFCELTLIRIELDDKKLKLQVLCSRRLHQHCESMSLPDQLSAFRDKLEEDGADSCRYLVAGEDLEELGGRISDDLGLCRPTTDEWAVAAGTARYAALCNEVRPRGTPYKDVDVDHVVPRSLGILGVYHGNLPCWRRLFNAGEPERKQRDPLTVGAGQGNVTLAMLAEAVDPECEDQLWLSEDDWTIAGKNATRLRTFFRVTLPPLGNAEAKLRFTLENRSGKSPVSPQVVRTKSV